MLHASRTLVWLKGQEVLVTYDQATTVHSGKFKRFNMNFIAPPTVSGNVVTAVGNVNKVQVTSLLPVNGNISVQVGSFSSVVAGFNVRGTGAVHVSARLE